MSNNNIDKQERKPYQGFFFKKRLKASLIHMGLSFIVFLVFMYLMFFHWYPNIHFIYNGGWAGTKIMIVVDIIIGPLITFFIYNARKTKKELKFDFFLIFLMQVALFTYGFIQVYPIRPATQVLTYKGEIRTSYYNSINNRGLYDEEKLKKLNTTKNKPYFVRLKNIANIHDKDMQKLNNNYAISPGLNESSASYAYTDITPDDSIKEMKKMAVKSRLALMTNDDYKKEILKFEKENKGIYFFFPIKLDYGQGVTVINDKGYIIDYLAMHHR